MGSTLHEGPTFVVSPIRGYKVKKDVISIGRILAGAVSKELIQLFTSNFSRELRIRKDNSYLFVVAMVLDAKKAKKPKQNAKKNMC